MIEAVLVHISLGDIHLDGAGQRPVDAIRDAAWRQAGAVVRARLRPWLAGGWNIVPGTLGPHSLRLRRLSGRRVRTLSRIVAPFARKRHAPGQEYELSAACLLRRG